VLEGCVEELAYVLGGGLVAVEDHYYARYRELACQEQIVCKKKFSAYVVRKTASTKLNRCNATHTPIGLLL
jgi:hypothetical protein